MIYRKIRFLSLARNLRLQNASIRTRGTKGLGMGLESINADVPGQKGANSVWKLTLHDLYEVGLIFRRGQLKLSFA